MRAPGSPPLILPAPSRALGLSLLLLALAPTRAADLKARARDLGVPFDGTPGPLNAITDVAGVSVGHATLISGQGKREVGKGPVRTGVTAVLPRGKQGKAPVFGAFFSQNGNGEMTGAHWLEESGHLGGPILLTNTCSVGIVRDAANSWEMRRNPDDANLLPLVAETWDGWLNDIEGRHVKEEHALQALEGAASGPVAEGNVGGGTGMVCFEFKGGIGTASRMLSTGAPSYTIGVLVQANFGRRPQLRIAGAPVGREIMENRAYEKENGSLIAVIATDAPLLPHQLKRVARRASLALGRLGAISGDGSGDIFLAFSTANLGDWKASKNAAIEMLAQDRLDWVFEATIQATEEAVVNALVAAETMTGADNRRVIAMPHDKLRQVLKKYNLGKN